MPNRPWQRLGCMNGALEAVVSARPANLQLKHLTLDAFGPLWKVPAQGDNLRLGLYVRLPDSAERLSDPNGMCVGGAYIERRRFREPNAMVGSTIQIDGL
jgi:hypothetical protein